MKTKEMIISAIGEIYNRLSGIKICFDDDLNNILISIKHVHQFGEYSFEQRITRNTFDLSSDLFSKPKAEVIFFFVTLPGTYFYKVKTVHNYHKKQDKVIKHVEYNILLFVGFVLLLWGLFYSRTLTT